MSKPSVSATTKRGRNDTSGVSESNVQLRPQYPQTTRIFNASNTPNKRHLGTNEQRYTDDHSSQFMQKQPGQMVQNSTEMRGLTDLKDNQHEPSIAACDFLAGSS